MDGIASNTSDKASKPNVLVGEGENAAGADEHQGDDPGSQVDLGDGGNDVGVNEDEDEVSDDDDTDVDETTNVRRKDKRRQVRESFLF